MAIFFYPLVMSHFFVFLETLSQLNLSSPESKIKCCFECLCTSLGHSYILLNSPSFVTAEEYVQY